WGNFLLFFMILVVFNKYVLDDAIHNFQNKALPWIMSHYESLLRWSLNGWRPVHLLLGTIALFFISLFIFVGSIGSGRIPITFFPKGDPN
ncbi:hypothetical protein, partial [Vibrio parahaemolyticus]